MWIPKCLCVGCREQRRQAYEHDDCEVGQRLRDIVELCVASGRVDAKKEERDGRSHDVLSEDT